MQRDPEKVALQLLRATSLSDWQVFRDLDAPRYTTVDYYRMACHLLFECKRCGNCCTTGDPIRLRPDDAAAIARHLKLPLNKVIKKYTVSDPEKPGVLDFKHILPCKFYDANRNGCKIYAVRPWSCRIFPFLGIYGSEDRVVVKESCPGSVETMKILKEAIEIVRAGQKSGTSDAAYATGPDESVGTIEPANSVDPAEVRRAKEFLRAALDLI